MNYRIFLFILLFPFAFAKCQLESKTIDNQNIIPQKGLVINESTSFKNGVYQLIATEDLHERIINIEGDSIEVDFNNLTLIGTDDLTKPDAFKGVAIQIQNGKHITIKNLNVKGYRNALRIYNVQHLTIENCNFSFNYRAYKETVYLKRNFPSAIFAFNSKFITIKNSVISNNYNAMTFRKTTGINIKNSKIQFHPKFGIVLKESYLDTLINNQMDWNLLGTITTNQLKSEGVHHYNSFTHNGTTNSDSNYHSLNDYTASDVFLDYKEIEYTPKNPNENIPQLNPKYPKGKIYKISTKYGVYNFEYPAIFLRKKENNQYTFAMFGPTVGNWKFVNAENVKSTNLKRGSFPATFILEKDNPHKPCSIEFEFIGAAFQDEFGVWNKKGKVFEFDYSDHWQYLHYSK
ncbi:MAG: right-handed parallel beta-helix repeat-containing protein [Saprospiraceae bacterium]